MEKKKVINSIHTSLSCSYLQIYLTRLIMHQDKNTNERKMWLNMKLKLWPVLWYKGTAVAQWLRCCATNRKVAGSIPAGVSGFFRLSLWQKWVPGVFPGGKGGRCVRLTTLQPSCTAVMKSGNLNFWNPLGHSRPVMGLLYLYWVVLNTSGFLFIF